MATIGEGILAMLASGPKTISEIYEGVPGKRTSIDKACWRLAKNGEIERVDHGLYRKKAVLGARQRGKISWETLSEDEKDNYRLNLIGAVIEDCCELMERAAYNQDADIVEKVESLEALFSSCNSFVESASKALRSLEAEWKADPPAGVDVEALFHGDGAKAVSLKGMMILLFDLIGEK